MKRTVLATFYASVITGLLLASCGGVAASPGAEPVESPVARLDPPEEYAGKTNPFRGDAQAASEGELLYQSNCYSCHGDGARGNGPAAAALEPKPSNLAKDQSELKDDYLLWRITEGGMMRPFNSVMPAWRGILTEEQIWKIITYLRTLEG